MNRREPVNRWVLGMTGASGAVYGVSLCRTLLAAGAEVHLIITEAGWRVLHEELGWNASSRQMELERHFAGCAGKLIHHPLRDVGAVIASGSYAVDGMVIMPCSMGTVSSIAHGLSKNLLERAADVMLKEGRPLLLVPRETPLHAVHLENMLTLARLGARIIPAMPAFYNHPQTIDDMVAFLVGKVLDSMGYDHDLYRRWGEADGQADRPHPHRAD